MVAYTTYIYKTHYGETIGVLQSNNQGDCKYDLSRINLNNFPNEIHPKFITYDF